MLTKVMGRMRSGEEKPKKKTKWERREDEDQEVKHLSLGFFPLNTEQGNVKASFS